MKIGDTAHVLGRGAVWFSGKVVEVSPAPDYARIYTIETNELGNCVQRIKVCAHQCASAAEYKR